MNFYKKYGKRYIDIILSTFGLIILFPVLLIVAILIKLESKGSILFCKKRIGKEGNLFKLIKFRTMLEDKSKESLQFTPGDRQRITKIGRVLRKIKIDELPTLINVLKGDMSLVGPRPEVPKYLHFYEGEKREILSIQPGITDFASKKYRDEEEILAKAELPEKMYEEKILPDKLELNMNYLRNISFKQDLQIILETIKVVSFSK